MFGHCHDAYVFGHGVEKFRAWMRENHPGVWVGLKRLVGNRSGIFLENALPMYYMAGYYDSYCDYLLTETESANALVVRLESKLRCREIMAGLRARAIMFVQFHQPLRNAIKSKSMGSNGRPPNQTQMGDACMKSPIKLRRKKIWTSS